MPLSKASVVEFLADLGEEEVEEILRCAAQRRGVRVGGLIYVKPPNFWPYRFMDGVWSQCLRSVGFPRDIAEGAVRAASSGAGHVLQNMEIDLRVLQPEEIELPLDRCRLSLLDAAILAGDRDLARALTSLRFPLVLKFQAGDFVHRNTGKMHEKHARMLEAAIHAGVDIGRLSGCWRCPRSGACCALSGTLNIDSLQERAIAGHQRTSAMLLRRCGAAGNFSGHSGCLLFRVCKRSEKLYLDLCCLQLAVDLGIDLKPIRVIPSNALECASHHVRRTRFRAWSKADTVWCTPMTLLDMAILCGQVRVAEWLASLGCVAGCMASASSHRGLNDYWRAGVSFPCGSQRIAVPREVTKHVYRQVHDKYHPLILQLTRWCHRAPYGFESSNIIVQHARILDYILQFVAPVPFITELMHDELESKPVGASNPVHAAIMAGYHWVEHEDRVVHDLPQLEAEPAAAIDPDEAAAVAEERWASFVEAFCARHRASDPSGRDPSVVVLQFGRDGLPLDEAVLSSSPGQRAIGAGLDVKPCWANGAKVLVEGITAEDVAEARLDLLPRHVVVRESDVGLILDAIASLPSRSRPRLKPMKPIVPLLAAGDVCFFTDVSGRSSSSCCSSKRFSDTTVSPVLADSASSAACQEGNSLGVSGRRVLPLQLPIGVTVKWTFLQVVEESSTDAPRSSSSV